MIESIRVDALSKSFRISGSAQHGTLKDLIVNPLRRGASSTVHALADVSFGVEHGSMLGVIGRNGSGKTTLLRLLCGILKPDAGTIHIDGSIAAVLALGTGFHPDLTGREGARIELLTLGMTRREADARLPAIADFAEIGEFFEAPIRTYSTGMMMRLAFACAICVDPNVLLLDEVLAVGDEAFAKKCLDAVTDFRTRGKTVVLVTHSAEIVEHFCDVALWLDRGRVAGLGDPHNVVSAYHALSGASAAYSTS